MLNKHFFICLFLWYNYYGDNMEQLIDTKNMEEARKILLNLVRQSGKFVLGGYPYIGTLDSSYGFGKKIGMVSFD